MTASKAPSIQEIRWCLAEDNRKMNEHYTDLLHRLEDAEFGCNEGLTAYGFCARKRGHEGKHWREDCGMWWFDEERGTYWAEKKSTRLKIGVEK